VACTVPASPYSAITMATEVHAIFAVTYITYVVLRWGLIIQQHCIARVAQKRPKCQCPQSTPRSRVCDNHQLKLLWEVKVSKWSEDQNQLLIMMLRQHQMLETTVLSCSVEETKMSWLKHSHIRTISVLLGEEQGLEMVFRQRTRSWDHNTPVLSLTRTRSRGGVETENKVMRPQHTCVESEKNKVSRWCSGKDQGVETTTHLCWVWQERGLEVVLRQRRRSWDHNTPVLSLRRTRMRSRGGVQAKMKVLRPQHTCVESEKKKVSRWCSDKEQGNEITNTYVESDKKEVPRWYLRQRTRSSDHNTPVLSLRRTRSRGGIQAKNKVLRPPDICVESDKNEVSRWCWDKEEGLETATQLCWVWEEQGLEVVFRQRTR